MFHLFGLTLLIVSVALVVYDGVVYFKGGRRLVLMTTEQLWNLLGGQRLFEVRQALTSVLGTVGDAMTDMPAVVITFSLGLGLVWVGQRSSERGR